MRSLRSFWTLSRRFCVSKTEGLKHLRNLTGAPIMKCKEALDKFATLDEAINFLKEKNLIMAEKKSNNVAKEGVLGVSIQPGHLMVVKINSETDFVAKNDEFLDFAEKAVKAVSHSGTTFHPGINALSTDILKSIKTMDGSDLLESQKAITGKIQENIKVSEVFKDAFDESNVVGLYVHKALKDNMGTSLGYVIVSHEGGASEAAVREVANDLAVHIFCKLPTYISFESIPEAILKASIEEIESSMDESIKKKPKEIQEKIREGKIKKAFDDEILYNQTADFWDSEKTVGDFLKDFEARHNTKIKVIKFNSMRI